MKSGSSFVSIPGQGQKGVAGHGRGVSLWDLLTEAYLFHASSKMT